MFKSHTSAIIVLSYGTECTVGTIILLVQVFLHTRIVGRYVCVAVICKILCILLGLEVILNLLNVAPAITTAIALEMEIASHKKAEESWHMSRHTKILVVRTHHLISHLLP